MSTLRPENDLVPGDLAVGAVILATQRFNDAADRLGLVRREFREQTGSNGDVVMLVVPAGKGRPFVDELMRLLEGGA